MQGKGLSCILAIVFLEGSWEECVYALPDVLSLLGNYPKAIITRACKNMYVG